MMLKPILSLLHKTKLLFLFFVGVMLISVNAQPVANFSASTTSGCGSLIPSFSDLSTHPGDPIVSWNWDFGDNSPHATVQNPGHIYSTTVDTCFDVTLTIITQSGAAATLTKPNYICVHQSPEILAPTIYSPTNGCAPACFEIGANYNSACAMQSVVWEIGAGNILTGDTVNTCIPTPGCQNVTLVLTNSCGCTADTVFNCLLQVAPSPVADFTASVTSSCIAPLTTDFINQCTYSGSPNAPAGTTFQWFMPGSSTPTASTPNVLGVTYPNSGSYDVTLIVQTPNGCTDTLEKTAYIGVGAVVAGIDMPDTVCAGQSFVLQGTGAATYSWDYDCDGTNNAGGTNVTVSYPTPGNYCVKVTASNGAACSGTFTKNFTVRPSPTAAFVVDRTTDCKVPSTFNFDGSTSAGTGLTYSWNFGAGANPAAPFVTSTPQVSATYNTFGNKNVILKVMNSVGCTDTESKPALIAIQSPSANFTTLQTEGCVPFTLGLINSSTSNDPITSYIWDITPNVGIFPNPVIVNIANPNFIINNQGTYDIKLIIQTAQGCRDTLEKLAYVKVGTVPNVDFTFTPATECIKKEISFSSTFTDPTWQYTWDFNYNAPYINASSSLPAPDYAYSDTGRFDVALVINNNGCRDTMIKNNIIFIKGPKADFTPTPAVACGIPATFSFDNTSQNALTGSTSYVWSFNNALPYFSNVTPAVLSPSDPPNQTYNGLPGTVPIKLKVFSASTGCSDSLIINLVVGNPIANFIALPTTICHNDSVLFTPTGQNASQYAWDFGDGGSTVFSTGPIKHAYTTNGTYSVSMVALDANQCQDTIVKNNHITVTGPLADFYADSTSGCTPFTTQFHDSVTVYPGTTIVNYSWAFSPLSPPNPAGPAASDPVHTFLNSGNYGVILFVTDSDNCVDKKAKGSYIQATFPITLFSADDTSTCEGNLITFTPQVPGASYSWDFGDNTNAITQGAGTIQHAYQTHGSYTVKLTVTDANGCTDSLTKINYISIDQMIPDFVGAPTTAACPPLVTIFQDSSKCIPNANGIIKWDWDFGDGTAHSFNQNPGHPYLFAGTFNVTLTVEHEDGCKTDTTFLQYIQLNGPYAQVVANKTAVCPGDTVTFTVFTERTQSITYQLESNTLFVNPNNYLKDTTIIKYVYTTPQIWPSKFIVKDVQGCSYVIPNTPNITVYSPPVAAFTPTPTGGCLPLLVVYANNSTPGLGPTGNHPINQYIWDFGPGQGGSALQNPQPYTFNVPGVYNNTLIVKDTKGCRDTAVVPITAYLQPTADFSATPTIQCAPAEIIFQDLTSITVPTSWTWIFGDISAPTAGVTDTIAHTYTSDGVYDVSLIISDANGCLDTITKKNYIYLRHPVASFYSDSTIGCEPFTTCFFAEDSYADTANTLIDTYYWSFGSGAPVISNLDSICHTYGNPGVYSVYLQVTDVLGCKDDTLINNYITVNQTSTPQVVDMLRATVENKGKVRVDYKIYPQPDFRQYLLYRYNNGTNTWLRVDSTSNVNQLTLYDNSAFLNCEDASYCYKVLIQNDCRLYSPLAATETHCTMNLSTIQDFDAIRLSWTGYNGWINSGVDSYDVYRSDVPTYDITLMNLIGTVPGNIISFTDTNTYCTDSAYYRVIAKELNGNAQISISDVSGNQPAHRQPTETVRVSTATVLDDKNVTISWYKYAGYRPSFYILEKSKTSNVWKELVTLPLTDTSYVDSDVYVDSLSYSYRVFASDSCGDRSSLGLIGKSIVLSVNLLEDETPSLKWNLYNQWFSGVQYYEVQVYDENNDWTTVEVIDNDRKQYDDYKTSLFQGSYCYRIVAHELAGGHQTSISNVDCVSFDPRLWAPNVFTPNNDGNNDIFLVRGPNITTFEMTIYDRWGRIVYFSKDMNEGWNGYVDGKPAPEGAFVYKVKGKGDKGDEIKLNGTVNLIR